MQVDQTGPGPHVHQMEQSFDKRGKIHYLQLGEAQPNNEEEISFYGVIIDAGHPFKGQSRYICTLKVVDPTLHSNVESANSQIKFGLVTCFAKRLEDLPVVRKIGDILRVHRAIVKEYKGMTQFNVNLTFNSSWCLFHSSDILLKAIKGGNPTDDQELAALADQYSSDDHDSDPEMETDMYDGATRGDKNMDKTEKRKYTPYKFSGKSYSFDYQQERVIVDQLRNWQDQFFMRNSWIFKNMSKSLGKVREESQHRENFEFDLLVKILKIFDKDEYNLELRIKDISNEMWFIVIPKLKFGPLKEGEIIRIRSVTVNITSKRNVISCKPSTNILRFTQKNAIVQEMRVKIEAETAADKMMLDDINEVIMSPVIYTDITNSDYERLPLFKLDDLFLNYDEIPLEMRKKNAFRIRFYALRVDPQDPREVVQAMDPETKETFSCQDLDGALKGKSKQSGQDCQFMYRIQFLVKDQASQLNKNFYRLLLYAYDTPYGEDFFQAPVEPCNLYAKENEEKLVSLKQQLNNMTRFNVWCDAIVERQNNFFLIRDTKIKSSLN